MDMLIESRGFAPDRTSRTLVERVFKQIRADILRGKLSPSSKLCVEHLRETYEAGASTLREALSRLVGDGLVIATGQRGFRVAPISLSDLRDVSEMRKLLETYALRESIRQGDDEWEGAVVAAYHRLSLIEERLKDSPEELDEEWEARNRRFHEALIQGCSNKWLIHFRNIVYDQSVRYRRLSLVNRSVPRDVHAEHRAIKEAALARDADRACRLTEEHIDRTQAVIAVIAPSLGTAADNGREDLLPEATSASRVAFRLKS